MDIHYSFCKQFQVCVLFSYVGVGIVLFIVSRFSPNEWKLLEPGSECV